jgi:hypothetical protein
LCGRFAEQDSGFLSTLVKDVTHKRILVSQLSSFFLERQKNVPDAINQAIFAVDAFERAS